MNAIRFVAATAALVVAAGAQAATVPFTEMFPNDAANWRDAGGGSLATWVASGGPANSPYITQATNVNNANTGVVTAIRGSGAFSSSGGAFVGNWITDGVSTFSFDVRHNAPVPLNVAARFASAANFPGAVAVNFIPILPNTWTTVTFAISAANPQFVSFEGSNFAGVFSSISNIQLAYSVPAGFEGSGLAIQFDADNISIVPAPGAAALLIGGMGVIVRRRRAGR
jgi:hypothetical protein